MKTDTGTETAARKRMAADYTVSAIQAEHREIIRHALQGAADMLKEAAKQFRLNDDSGHSKMSERHRKNCEAALAVL